MLFKDGLIVLFSGINKVIVKGCIYIYYWLIQYCFKFEWGIWELVDEVKIYIVMLLDLEVCKLGIWGGLVLVFMKLFEWVCLVLRMCKDYEICVFVYF